MNREVNLASLIFQDLFLVSYVEERPRWPIQSLNKGRKKKATIDARSARFLCKWALEWQGAGFFAKFLGLNYQCFADRALLSLKGGK